jgi:hypothetical protein
MRDETQPPPGWYWLDKSRGKLARVDGLTDLAGAWAEFDEEHATQHPNPLCPHTLECLCDESEAG